jgi:hypothetical protein
LEEVFPGPLADVLVVAVEGVQDAVQIGEVWHG